MPEPYLLHGDVAVIRMDHPPLNALDQPLRRRLHEALVAAQNDPAVQAIVITGTDRAFSSGADMREFGTERHIAEPHLRSLAAAVENGAKPVVAAIAGLALGGGLELAMACHARVVSESARLGMPELQLGLIPGAGGTQRLPRLVGIERAIEIIAKAEPIRTRELADSGLIDAEVPDEDPLPAAVALAHRLAAEPARIRRARDVQLEPARVREALAEADKYRATAEKRWPKPYDALLRALEATLLPFDEGLALERALFDELLDSRESHALRHLFFAERVAHKLPAVASAEIPAIERIAVVGCGPLGVAIAVAALDAGLKVVLVERKTAWLEDGVARLRALYRARMAAHQIKTIQAIAAESRLTATADWTQMARAQLVIEATADDLPVKQAVLRKMDMFADHGAILATTTAHLDLDEIAAVTSRPKDVIGLHFFSLTRLMRLIEVVRGSASSAQALASGIALARVLKKTPVLCSNSFGYIGNRVCQAMRRACDTMLEEGAWPEDVDAAMEGFGYGMGPFTVADRAGLDDAWRIRQAHVPLVPAQADAPAPVLEQLYDAGHLGVKTGGGYYHYDNGRRSEHCDAITREIIERASQARGIKRAPLAPADIRRRALAAMVNEAALVLEDGVAERADDIDVVMVQAYGFPRWEGGPVFWARSQERASLERDLQLNSERAGPGARRGKLDLLLQA